MATEEEEALQVLQLLVCEAEADRASSGVQVEEHEVAAVAPCLEELVDGRSSEEVCSVLLRTMRRLLCRRSEVAAATVAELRLLSWVWEWLDLAPEQRQELARLGLQGFAALSQQVQARHLALLIDVQLARYWWEGEGRRNQVQQGTPDADGSQGEAAAAWVRRCKRSARAGQLVITALAALPTEELDALGQEAVAELQARISSIGVARAVLRLAPSRRRQLMDILVREEIMTEESALRLFRALTALESLLGVDGLDAVLMAADMTVSAGVGVFSAGSSVLDLLGTVGSETRSSIGALGSWTLENIMPAEEQQTDEAGEQPEEPLGPQVEVEVQTFPLRTAALPGVWVVAVVVEVAPTSSLAECDDRPPAASPSDPFDFL